MGKRESARQRRRGIVRAKGGAKFAFSRIRVPAGEVRVYRIGEQPRSEEPEWTTYEQYLLTDGWRQRRTKFIASRKDKACEACGYSRSLQVHHKTYERLGKERNSDLVLLCRDCHESLHQFRAAERISLWTATRRFLKLARRAS